MKEIESIPSSAIVSLMLDEDILSKNFDDLLGKLEQFVEDIKEERTRKASELLGDKSELIVNGMKIAKVRVFTKYAELDEIDKRFVKVERKLNTQAVNEYYKENKKLPEGVSEVLSSERISVKEAPKPKEKKVFVKKNQEALDFKDRFNKLSKKRK